MGPLKLVRISGAIQALIDDLSATKGGARLAQSLGSQGTEKIGFFKDFSTPPTTVSEPAKKRDSQRVPRPLLGAFSA
jgi:hypothetical protein